jgi:hypothetical protein
MKTTILFSISILIMLSFTSCKKVEGPGGSSSIKGKIHGMRYDGAGNLLNEYDVAKHDVYLIYGDNTEDTYFDDDIETSYDGSFEFDYLEEGTYRLFVYEKCTTCNSGKAVIMQTIEIDKKKSAIDVGTINVRV